MGNAKHRLAFRAKVKRTFAHVPFHFPEENNADIFFAMGADWKNIVSLLEYYHDRDLRYTLCAPWFFYGSLLANGEDIRWELAED